MDWQPIETAPTDKVVDLWVRQENSQKWRDMFPKTRGSLLYEEYRITDCRWNGDRWVKVESDEDTIRVEIDDWTGTQKATHWMLQPEPPK